MDFIEENDKEEIKKLNKPFYEEFSKEINETIPPILKQTLDKNYKRFKFIRETETIGEPVRYFLLKNQNVIFCSAYKLNISAYEIIFEIKTNGIETPENALIKAIESVLQYYSTLKDEFLNELNIFNKKNI